MEQWMNVLVVDDEPYNREELKYLLGSYREIKSVKEAESGEEAVMNTMRDQPDVIFLDVEMPKMNGMEVAESIRKLKNPPLIVFATAYPQFAAEAFRYEAVDYLLKPYDEAQLEETMQRLVNKHVKDVSVKPDRAPGKLSVEVDGDIHYLELKDILYMERVEKKTRLITKQGEFSTNAALKVLEARLLSHGFFRIHKSFLVNLKYIQKLTPWFNGAYHLQLEGTDEKLSVSRNYVKSLREQLEL